MSRALSLLLLFGTLAHGATLYVSTTGTDGGAGTLGDPLSLTKALSNSSPATAGDTIYVRGGTYLGNGTGANAQWSAQLVAPSNNPIIIRNYPGERATLDVTNEGSQVLVFEGSGTWIWGLEIMNSNTNRIPVRGGLAVNSSTPGHGNKLINCVLHDLGNAIFISGQATNTEICGNVIYNNGWQDYSLPDEDKRGHGHGMYGQNSTTNGFMVLRDNISFNAMGYGLQLFTVSKNIDNFKVDRNIFFRNGIIAFDSAYQNVVIGGTTISNLLFNRNILWWDSTSNALNAQIVWQSALNGTATIRSNYFIGQGSEIKYWTNMDFRENTFAPLALKSMTFYPMDGMGTYNWNSNRYFYNSTPSYPICTAAVCVTFAEWQGMAWTPDANSTLTVGNPTGTETFLDINPYDGDRANLTILNWNLSNNIPVDLSSIVGTGNRYRVRNVQDYFGAVCATGIYSGPVSIPMTNLNVAAALGLFAPSATGPQFGAFVVEDLGAVSGVYYVNPTVVGTSDNSGTTWANAFTNMPNGWSGTDTIYVHGGTNGAAGTGTCTYTNIDSADQFRDGVTIRIGQDTDHDGLVIFNGSFGSRNFMGGAMSNATWSGQVGSGTNRQIQLTNYFLSAAGSAASNITFRYMDLHGGVSFQSSDTITIQGCRLDVFDELTADYTTTWAGTERILFLDNDVWAPIKNDGSGFGADHWQNANSFIVSNSMFRTRSVAYTAGQHSDGIQADLQNSKILNSIFLDLGNYGILGDFGGGNKVNCLMAGNVFVRTATSAGQVGLTIGPALGSPTDNYCSNYWAINNTFIDYTGTGQGLAMGCSVSATIHYTNCYAFNNLFYNVKNPMMQTNLNLGIAVGVTNGWNHPEAGLNGGTAFVGGTDRIIAAPVGSGTLAFRTYNEYGGLANDLRIGANPYTGTNLQAVLSAFGLPNFASIDGIPWSTITTPLVGAYQTPAAVSVLPSVANVRVVIAGKKQ